ncbi:helix-turn-helix domain-containing protein [Streptomyces nigra]|uniref:helix-turn-helix domain-containing protein n=1 Tax=Streptomyces nigra TaxID=1827580 RepID=UPI00362ED5DA
MKSLYERFAGSDDGAQLLAAARLRREVLRLLHRALEASGLTQSQLAERLNVRKSAVSQVFRGDGNLRINTLAHYLGAMGYELDVRLVNAGEPRAAVLEGREMVPAIKQDWVTSPSENASDETDRVKFSHDGYIAMGRASIELSFLSRHLTSTMVEMCMDSPPSRVNVLYGFHGSTSETEPEIRPNAAYHPIRSEATS